MKLKTHSEYSKTVTKQETGGDAISRISITHQVLLSALLMAGVGHLALAACPQNGEMPMRIGPYNPQTTFPLWVQDSEDLTLEICPGTDQLNCISVPPFTIADFPGDPQAAEKAALSQQIGFGDEGFWASADAIMDIPPSGTFAGGSAILVSGVEAAFLPDFADGNQTAFTRLRIRVDIPQVGTYTVTHPWGKITYNITTPGNKAINDSFDVPFVADQTNYLGRLGPVLTWDTFPNDPLLDLYGPPYTFTPPYGTGGPDGVADYIGTINYVNPVTGGSEHAVKGSPCGTNYFRIDGPNIGGQGVNFVETNLFTVTGKLFTGTQPPTPLSVSQMSYSRSKSGNVSFGSVNAFARAPSHAAVSFSGSANLPSGTHVMPGDGSGRFFSNIALTPDAATLPAQVSVTADNRVASPRSQPVLLNVPLVDLVTVTRADYSYATGELTIEAHSSDLLISPTLSTLGQALNNGVLTINLAVAPSTVTVTSSAGGAASIPVTIIHN